MFESFAVPRVILNPHVISEERRLQIVVALSGAALMSLEILGSRVLAPAYGSSVYVWGSLITVFLTALAVGYALGGRLADRRPSLSRLSVILSVAAVLILPSVEWASELLEALAATQWDVRWSALAASLILFLPTSLLIGMVSPFAVRVAVRRLERVGAVAGGYSALSTAGSILGTLLTAFLLIPSFSVQSLLLTLSGTLAFCALLLMKDRVSVTVAAAAVLACGVTGFARRPPQDPSGTRVLVSRDTAYHHIRIIQIDQTRLMRFDSLTQGGLILNQPDRSIFGYEEGFFGAWVLRPGIRRVCVIGLGAGTFPRRLAAKLPEAEIDTIEIDPVVVQLAGEYFSYAQTPRNRATVGDGRAVLARARGPYDLVVLDAYNATGVPFHLMTREFYDLVKSRMTPDGVFAANFIGRLMGRDNRLFWASYRTLRERFGQVYLMNPELASGKSAFEGNLILLSTLSADPMGREEFRERAKLLSEKWKLHFLGLWGQAFLHSPDPPPGTPVLTDSFAPVEALQHF